MDEDIEELKELVKENIAATEENTRILRKMRRSAMWGWVLQIIWWLVVAGVTGAAYYYYVQPYVTKIEQLYGVSQEQSQSWNEQITNFLKYFSQQKASQNPQSGQTPPATTSASTTAR